jgi:hypothetical protein
MPTGDRVVIRTGLPSVYWRALNQGIPNSKSTTAQVDEACGILEARSEVDKDLAMLNGNTAQFRLSEDSAFLEAMNQEQAKTLLYGDPSGDPRKFLGIAPRYSSLSGNASSANVLSAGGAAAAPSATNLTSIYLVSWGDQTVYCPFPKGSKAGLMHEDLGEQTIYNGDERMQALATRYQWKNGLVVKDWRYVVRIANILTTDLLTGATTQAPTAHTNIIKLMLRAVYKLPSASVGRPAFYMNRTTHSGLALAALDRTQSVVEIKQGLTQFGTPHSWLSFLGIPVRCVDQITNNEAVVA